MNSKQYNNVIAWTLKNDESAKSDDSLSAARAIFKNMGVALPQGDCRQVFETLKTDDYMGWRSCTVKEAQEAANGGTAAIGINEERIVVISAADEEEADSDIGAETAAVMTLSEMTSAYAVSDLQFYSYGYGTTTNTTTTTVTVSRVLDKPYDPDYPYTLNGVRNNISEEQYYTLLNSYSYTLRNDIVFEFTFNEVDSFRSYLVSSLYKSSTEQERTRVVENIYTLAKKALSYIPVLGDIIDAIDTGVAISALNTDNVKENIIDITNCVEAFSHIIGNNTSVPKSTSVTYKISLLKQSPVAGRQIKIESSDGYKDIYTIKNGTYDMVLMTATANTHCATVYKIAPEWSYYWE